MHFPGSRSLQHLGLVQSSPSTSCESLLEKHSDLCVSDEFGPRLIQLKASLWASAPTHVKYRQEIDRTG